MAKWGWLGALPNARVHTARDRRSFLAHWYKILRDESVKVLKNCGFRLSGEEPDGLILESSAKL